MNKQNLALAGIGLAIVLSLFNLFKSPQQVPNVIRPGAAASPDIQSPYFSYGGVRHWAAMTNSLQQATTTVCAIQSPAATSTLISASFDMSTTSATTGTVNGAVTISMGKGTNQYVGTSTLLGQVALASWQMNQPLIASTTPATGSYGTQIFSPNTWFLVGISGNLGYSATGVCTAEWVQNSSY